jgi:hypothetical protein
VREIVRRWQNSFLVNLLSFKGSCRSLHYLKGCKCLKCHCLKHLDGDIHGEYLQGPIMAMLSGELMVSILLLRTAK